MLNKKKNLFTILFVLFCFAISMFFLNDNLKTDNAFAEGHEHNFSFSSSGAVLTALCDEENCNLIDSKVEVTLSALDLTYGEGPAISLLNIDEFNLETGLNISLDSFTKRYYLTDAKNKTTDGELMIDIPKDVGYYYLVLTSSSESPVGEQSIVTSFEIEKREITINIFNRTKDYLTEPISLRAEVIEGELVYDDMDPYVLSCEVTSSSEMGEYDITGVCINPNYDITFVDGIYTVKNVISPVDSRIISDWYYYETPKTPSAIAVYGTVIYKYTNGIYDYKLWSDGAPTEPGKYYLKAEVVDSINYYCAERIEVFYVNKAKVIAPAESLKNYYYNGVMQSYDIEENPEYYTITGKSQSFAGQYSVVIQLKDKDYCEWSSNNYNINGTANDIEYIFTIKRKPIEKPAQDNRIFIYNGNYQQYAIQSTNDYEVVNSTIQKDVGEYEIIIAINDPMDYEWADGTTDDLRYPFVINQYKINSTNIVSVLLTENGIDPDITLKTQNAVSGNLFISAQNTLKSKLSKYERVYSVYDVAFIKNSQEIQPNGNIVLKIAVPKDLVNSNFKLYHIHTDSETGEKSVSQIEHSAVDKDGNIVVQVDELSYFAFVYEKNSLMTVIVIFAVVSFILAGLLVVQIVTNKNKKELKKTKISSFAASVLFFVKNEVILAVVLGIILIALIVLNVLLMIKRCRNVPKKNTKIENIKDISNKENKTDKHKLKEDKQVSQKTEQNKNIVTSKNRVVIDRQDVVHRNDSSTKTGTVITKIKY